MRRFFLFLLLFVFIIMNTFGVEFDSANRIFFEARRDRDVEKIKSLINSLESDKDLPKKFSAFNCSC